MDDEYCQISLAQKSDLRKKHLKDDWKWYKEFSIDLQDAIFPF